MAKCQILCSCAIFSPFHPCYKVKCHLVAFLTIPLPLSNISSKDSGLNYLKFWNNRATLIFKRKVSWIFFYFLDILFLTFFMPYKCYLKTFYFLSLNVSILYHIASKAILILMQQIENNYRNCILNKFDRKLIYKLNKYKTAA